MSCRSAIVCLLGASLLPLGGCDRPSPAPGQANGSSENASTAAAPAAAPIGQIDRSHAGEPAPEAAFAGLDGKPVTLTAFRGKPVIVNLWATWCAPCLAEMPALDTAAKAAGDRVAVIAVSQDLDGEAKVGPFLKAHPLAAIRPYLDPKLALSTAWAANLPTTIKLDAAGREVWRVAGGYPWDSAAGRALLGT